MTQQPYKLPLPNSQPESDYYWEKAKAHELWLRKCNECGDAYFYPRDICPNCYSNNVTWIQASGKATLYAYSIVERGPTPPFRDVVPYIAAVVELEEGPRMPTNLVDVPFDEEHIKVGMALQVTFHDVTDEVTLPKFRPVG
ncbi:MAG: OB-fold domain-containing protein [Chloroflexi bacterium]|nr:OB-fold domain-containing protein [Chloroflexota bacterium]